MEMYFNIFYSLKNGLYSSKCVYMCKHIYEYVGMHMFVSLSTFYDSITENKYSNRKKNFVFLMSIEYFFFEYFCIL